jgi:mercuric ion transport protein
MVMPGADVGMGLDSVPGYGQKLTPVTSDLPPTPAAPTPASPAAALAAGALAALAASACCLGPLVLLLLGVYGAWIGKLAALEPWQPLFVAVALGSLALAGWHLWRPAPACTPGQVCALPQVRRGYRALFVAVALLVALVLGFPWIAPWFY